MFLIKPNELEKDFFNKANWFSDWETTSSAQYHMLHDYNPLWKYIHIKAKRMGLDLSSNSQPNENLIVDILCLVTELTWKICGSPFCNPLYYLLYWAGTSVQSHKIVHIVTEKMDFCFMLPVCV